MSETLSVYRNENKYILSKTQVNDLKFKLDKLLTRDEHSKESYIVRSLYFDSINDIDFNTKLAGTEIRKKIRIRTYDPQMDKCKLEMKQKNGNLQHKISMWISKEDAESLIHLDYSVLTKYFDQNEDAINFYKVMTLGCYKPVVLVEYDRLAYIYPLNDTRLTIDMNIRSSESNFNLFDEKPIYTPILEDQTLLEVKYNNKLLTFISNVLKKYNLTRFSVSKYCYGRKIFYDFNF